MIDRPTYQEFITIIFIPVGWLGKLTHPARHNLSEQVKGFVLMLQFVTLSAFARAICFILAFYDDFVMLTFALFNLDRGFP